MARKPDGTWSPPAAIGLSGVGWGLILGGSLKHIVYLIYDENTLKSMAGDVGFKIATQMEASIATWGRSAEAASILANTELGANFALSYSQGMFGGFSLEGAICRPRPKINEKFYGQACTPQQILFGEEPWLEIPEGTTLIEEVYEKLIKLSGGTAAHEPTEEELQKSESIRLQAEEEGEEHLNEEEVVYEDVEQAATEEGAATAEETAAEGDVEKPAEEGAAEV